MGLVFLTQSAALCILIRAVSIDIYIIIGNYLLIAMCYLFLIVFLFSLFFYSF